MYKPRSLLWGEFLYDFLSRMAGSISLHKFSNYLYQILLIVKGFSKCENDTGD